MKYSAGIAAALLLFAESASARDRVELAPYSQWVANYDADSCALQRQFGEVGRQAYLELRQFGAGQDMQVTIASKDFDNRLGRFRVAFTPVDAEASELNGFDMRGTEENEGKLFGYVLKRDDPEAEAAYREFVRASPLASEEQKATILRSIDMDGESAAYARLWRNEDFRLAALQINEAFRQTEAWRNSRDSIERDVRGILIEDAFEDDLSCGREICMRRWRPCGHASTSCPCTGASMSRRTSR